MKIATPTPSVPSSAWEHFDRDSAERVVSDTLKDMDDGELYVEYAESESLLFDDGRIKNASFDICQGFGLRAVSGDVVGFAHASQLNEGALKKAADTVTAITRTPQSGHFDLTPNRPAVPLYTAENPLVRQGFADKVALVEAIDTYIRAKDHRVTQVSVSLSGEWQKIDIMKAGGWTAEDIRPLVRLNVSVVASDGTRMETGSAGAGGRKYYDEFITEGSWKELADEALRIALVNLIARPAPAGEFPVVLGPGWPGVMLHEAVGHGLEGDFNRKGTSIFSGRVGEQVAAKGVTVVDDGTLTERRGSLTIDDEGTPTNRNVLIEDGILKGYMQDRTNARLMGVAPTGNGRRESYASQPMPRMTNTFMESGQHTRDEMIASVKKGIYAAHFGGGQVDIVSGKFVFSATEAYMIEDGKVTHPIKGATLIGNGPDVMKKITMVGNDLELDRGVGMCGKAGQKIPVCVGQPSMLISKLTVGGTEMPS